MQPKRVCQREPGFNANDGRKRLRSRAHLGRHGSCSSWHATAETRAEMSRSGTFLSGAAQSQDGFCMKHPSTRELFAYWDRCRGERAAPERADIEPGAIRHVLADTFILSFDRLGGHPFRLAGTRICALFTRELKDEPFMALWEGADRRAFSNLLTVLADETTGFVASVTGETADGLATDLELLLLPLAHRGRPASRLLGALAPAASPYWLGVKTVRTLTLGTFRHVGPQVDRVAAPQLVPSSKNPAGPAFGRRKHSLTIYQGGRGPE